MNAGDEGLVAICYRSANDILTDRRYALNILAGSVLCKQLMPPDVVVKDGRYTKTDELMSSEIGFWDGQEPLDPRVQITPSLADSLVSRA